MAIEASTKIGRRAGATALARFRPVLPAAALLGLALVLRIPTLSQPLLEYHVFRQTQTAYTAVLFHERGVDFLHPLLPVLGPPFQLPFEFPLFQASAAAIMALGPAPDTAVRLTALVWFTAAGAALWFLVRQLADPRAANFALFLFVASPFAFTWSRASTIEWTAATLGLAYAITALRWLAGSGHGPWLLAVATGALAMMTKVTTGLAWAIPVGIVALHVLTGRGGRKAVTPGIRLAIAALLTAPLTAGIAWTVHADRVKSMSVLSSPLRSGELAAWNFGDLAARFDPYAWAQILERVVTHVMPIPLLLLMPAALPLVARSPHRLAWLGLLATAVVPILVFFNLFVVHDYYLAAVVPAIAAFGGLASSWLWLRARRSTLRVAGAATALLITGLWFVADAPYWTRTFLPVVDDQQVLTQAAELTAHTTGPELVVVEGRDWDPAVLYYARRWGVALPEFAADGLGRDVVRTYRVLSAYDPAVNRLRLLRALPWTGVLGRQLYVGGATSHDLRGSHFIATDLPIDPPDDASSLLASPVSIPCGGTQVQLPTGGRGTWYQVDPDYDSDARLWLVNGLAPMPVRSTLILDAVASASGTGGTAVCSGGREIVITAAFDAPMPAAGRSLAPTLPR